MAFGTALADLLDLVFPAHCAGCATMLPPGRHACEPCLQSLVALDVAQCCPRCLDAAGGRTCERCAADPPPFDHVHAPLLYGGAVKDAVHRMKFGDAAWVADALVGMAWPEAPDAWRAFDVMVPVPLHAARHRERGYNQARLVAEAMSRRTDVPVAAQALKRVKATSPVAELPVDARAAMVADAFAAGDPVMVRGRRVALVDDVVTTSATVRACSAVLRAMGASSVDVLCVARGGRGAES